MGVCARSTLTIDERGVVHFNSTYPFKRTRTRTMTRTEMTELVRSIREFDFFNFQYAGSRGCSMDGYYDSFGIRMMGHEKSFEDHGCNDIILDQFKDRIEALALRRIDWGEQLRAMRTFVPDSCGEDDCRKASIRVAHRSMLLLSFGYPLTPHTAVIRVGRDGSVQLRPGHSPYIYEVQSKLSPRRLRELQDAVAELKSVKGVREPFGQFWPEKWLKFVVPKGDKLPIVDLPLAAICSPSTTATLEMLVDERTYISDAKLISVEIVTQGTNFPVYPWPAEDLVPAAQLSKRTFTPAEWNAIAKRLDESPPANEYAPPLDGKQFGVSEAVYLRLITSTK